MLSFCYLLYFIPCNETYQSFSHSYLFLSGYSRPGGGGGGGQLYLCLVSQTLTPCSEFALHYLTFRSPPLPCPLTILPPSTMGISCVVSQACYTGGSPVPSNQDPSRKRRRNESDYKDLFSQFMDFMSSREGAPVKPPSSAPAALGAPPPDASSSQTYPHLPPIAHSSGSQLGWACVGSAPISDGSQRTLSLTGAPPSYNPSIRDVAGSYSCTAFDSHTSARSGVDSAATIPVFNLSGDGRLPPPPPPPRRLFSLPFLPFRELFLLPALRRTFLVRLFFPIRPTGKKRPRFCQILRRILHTFQILRQN